MAVAMADGGDDGVNTRAAVATTATSATASPA